MTATLILESLAKEFSVEPQAILAVFEMVDAGLSSPFVGRFRRSVTGGLSESQIRRLTHRRKELEDLDRRRGTVLRTLERVEGIDEAALEPIRRCTDRFELEDLFVPHRRPEPEVQLALDRGLGALADLLVAPRPRSKPPGSDGDGPPPEEVAEEGSAPTAPTGEEATVEGATADEATPDESTPDESTPDESTPDESTPEGAPSDEPPAEPSGPTPEATADALPESAEPPEPAAAGPAEPRDQIPGGEAHAVSGLPSRIAVSPELARLCEPFVDPDRGIHTDTDALAGAVRILSDRLGRNSHLRTLVRRMLRKRGVLAVRPLVEPGRAGRHKPLLRLEQPLRQVQGHRLLAIRQAQKERVLNTVIRLSPEVVLPKVRAVFGSNTDPAFDSLLDEVARQALEQRLLPVVEADVRLELKERGDQEALRFLSQHLRQVLFTPPFGRHPVCGVDVNARGDWTLAFLDENGDVAALQRVEVGDKDPASLAAELTPLLEEHPAQVMGVGHGKGPRAGGARLRAAIRAARKEVVVTIVNENGVSSYANSELARKELPGSGVPQRLAISLGRRIQDPMAEILKVDPRHLGLGAEQGLVSKANARRVFIETIESCVAHVGCDLNCVPLSVLVHVPGLDAETAKRLIAARDEKPFESREQLRTDGLLTEAQWTSAVAFLRIPGSSNPLDATSLHPELYPLATQLLESAGGSVEESLGHPGVTRGLRRTNFDVDEATWRDLMRELSHAGRDPRFRLLRPELLHPDTDAVRLTSGRVVDGIVTNVASFGAFVDVGTNHDAMVHISEVSSRYVRDARELLSVGQVVRARIVDCGGHRLSLSLKNVPPRERRREGEGRGTAPGQREGRGGRDGGRGGDRGTQEGRGGGRDSTQGRGRGGPRRDGPRGGPGRGPGRAGGYRGGRHGDRDRMTREEREDLERLNASASEGVTYNPFASFFRDKEQQENVTEEEQGSES